MPTRRATTVDEAAIRSLLRTGHQVYTNYGSEDLQGLLTNQLTWVGSEDNLLWGVLVIEREERPASLPTRASDRAYVRAVALVQGRSPTQEIAQLINTARAALQNHPRPTQLITYGGEGWLTRPLLSAGFVQSERVAFYQLTLTRRHSLFALPFAARTQHTPPVAQTTIHTATLRPATPADLEPLAYLDAATFPPLWHFGTRDLWELLWRSRLQVATQPTGGSENGGNEEIVGYSALTTTGDEAQLARLAVHPNAQGQGIGKSLLQDVIDYARANTLRTINLNTQSNNLPAQHLYRQLGFRATGLVIPIYTLECVPVARV